MAASKAVVLLSGGLDSTTSLAIAKNQGYDCCAISFQYGQRHVIEIEACKRVVRAFDIQQHLIIDMALHKIGGSALTDMRIDVPKGRSVEEMLDIPVTYVPARNLIFLSYALAWAEVLNASAIFIGVNHLDYSGYPDCRPEFIQSFEKTASLATKEGVHGNAIKIVAPLIEMSKAQIIRKGVELGVDYGITHSCYSPDQTGLACGQCDSCLLRRHGFEQAGVADPTRYSKPK